VERNSFQLSFRGKQSTQRVALSIAIAAITPRGLDTAAALSFAGDSANFLFSADTLYITKAARFPFLV